MKLRRKGLLRYGKHTTYFILLFIISVCIGIGYSYLNSNLGITGFSTIKNASWDVHFSNVQVQSGSVENGTYEITSNSTVLNFQASLDEPGNYYNFTVDVNNTGTIDAMLGSIVNTGLNTEQSKYLEYTVTYSDGTEIKEKDLIGAATAETLLVKVKYKDDVAESDLPTEDQTINLQLNMTYIQADDTAVVINHPVCRRATTLHTSGSSTIGNLGTTGTLAPGDAFDCDVNKDGTYDAENERFYFVSNLDTNSNYAVLIYFSNVYAGTTVTTASTHCFPYNQNSQSGEFIENLGPSTIMKELPTTSLWKNVRLSNTTRNILDEQHNIKVANFSYEGRAARLLTRDELISACGSGDPTASQYLNNCKFLLENTQTYNNSYVSGYWLETRYSDSNSSPTSNYNAAWYTNSSNLRIRYDGAFADWVGGARPTIEVPKSRIIY